jgi:alpha-beta hydrolase superfamily lysophospholipase
MNSFEAQWKTRDGLDICGQGWEPEGGIKAVICLVHGIGEHVTRYAHVAQALTQAGYAVFGFDLRGHGRSGGPRGHTPSIEAFRQDIDLLFENAQKRYPGLPRFLYGHSLGGILVLNYTLVRKPNVKGVIATSPGLHTALHQQHFKVMLARVLGTLLPTVLIPSELDTAGLSHDVQVVRAYNSDPLVHDKISLGFGRIMLGVTQWTLDHASEFPAPLLLMHGKEDPIAFPSSSTDFAAPLKDKCTLMLWDGMYHELHNESVKAEVFKTMTIWMDARLQE